MKAVAYCRVSSKDQVTGTSLDTQEESIRAWCERLTVEPLPYSAIEEAGASMYRGERVGSSDSGAPA